MKPRPSLLALAVLCFIALHTSRCNAWNSTGHEIIAQIAYDQLSPAAKSAVLTVLRNHPRLNEDLLHDPNRAGDDNLAMFLRAATWPDMVRSLLHPMNRTVENHRRWHFVDFPLDLDGVRGPQPKVQWDGHGDPENLLQAAEKVLAELKDPNTPPDRKAIDLCWLEHLVGDVHQPLHAVSLFSKQYPQGDQGGNLEMIRNGDGVVIPLHTYWDDIEGLSLDPGDVRKAADRIEAAHPKSEFKDRISDLSFVHWAKESVEAARSVVYLGGTLPHAMKSEAQADPKSVPPLPPGYAEKALATADVRIALAGYRLAAVLEEVAKSMDN